MRIQVNTDKNINNSEGFTEDIARALERKLEKFKSHITTVEVFLADANSTKSGSSDQQCSIEVRLEGHEPIAASDSSDSLKQAFTGASKKIERIIGDTLEKMRGR